MQTKSTFAGFKPVFNSPPTINNKGCIFHQAPIRYNVLFKDSNLPIFYSSTDYGRKKKNRNDKLQVFIEQYQTLLIQKQVSVICLIAYADEINNMKDFIKYFKFKKLKKHGVIAKGYGHIKINDIGKNSQRPHCHIFIVAQYFDESKYAEIFKPSKEHKYKGIPMNDTFGLIPYCQKKELYVTRNGKSWSSSPKRKKDNEEQQTKGSN